MPNTKPAFALRPPHSIRRELELLNPFVRREQTGQMRPYTMAEIEATEQRLGCRLPEPIRDLYLIMGDYLCLENDFYFRALELLRWDGDFLLLMHGQSDDLGFGLRRGDPYATVYEWICDDFAENEDEEDDDDNFGVIEYDFEFSRHQGDSESMREDVEAYFDFWANHPECSEICPDTIHQNTYAQFTYFWDAFILYNLLTQMTDDAYILDERKMTAELDQFYISSDLPRQAEAMQKTAAEINRYFEPISPHLELISNIGWPDLPERLHRIFAYYNPQDDCLLLTYPESPDGYYLLTKQPVPYSFAQYIAQKTGLVFCSRNGHGKELVTARRQEMQEQGLLY